MTIATSPGANPFEAAVLPHAGLARHRLSNDVRNDRYPNVPEVFLRLIRAEDLLDAESARLEEPIEPFHEYLARIGKALIDGEDLVDDLPAAAQAVLVAHEHRRVGLLALGDLRYRVEKGWDRAAKQHADEMLAGMADQLGELVQHVRAVVACLGSLDPSDPEAVAEATSDQVDALATLKDYRRRYVTLRRLQHQLLTVVGNHRSAIGSGAADFRDVALLGPPEHHEHQVLWYRPLVDREPWIPSIAEMKEAVAAISKRPTDPGYGGARPATKAENQIRHAAPRGTGLFDGTRAG